MGLLVIRCGKLVSEAIFWVGSIEVGVLIMINWCRCAFRPEVLACGHAGANATACLTPAQIANLLHIYTPWYEANNTFIFEGLSPGAEGGFGFLFNGVTPQFGKLPHIQRDVEFAAREKANIKNRNRLLQKRSREHLILGL